MTVIFGRDGKIRQTLAISLCTDFPICHLLLHWTQRDVFPVDFSGSGSQPLIRSQYDKARSSLTPLDHRYLEAEETAPAQGSVSLRRRTSNSSPRTDIHLSKEPAKKGRADRGRKENLIRAVLEGPLDERVVGTIFSLPSGLARACQFVVSVLGG